MMTTNQPTPTRHSLFNTPFQAPRNLCAIAALLSLGLLVSACDARDEDEDIVTDIDTPVADEAAENEGLISDRRPATERSSAQALPEQQAMPKQEDMPNTRPARDLETTQPTPGDNGNNGNVRDLTQLTSAVATMSATNGGSVEGEISFEKSATGVRITGELTGLEPGNHGIHVHENGDCSGDKAEGSGGHFAPEGDPHGAPSDQAEEHHVGDLGNLVAEADGTATVDLSDNELTLNRGPNGIIGKALVVHAGEDDLTSQPSGNSGDPISCGVIQAG